MTAGPGLVVRFRALVPLRFRDTTLKVVFEVLSRAGVNVLIDKKVNAARKISIFVKYAAVPDAIDLILLQTQLEKKVENGNTLPMCQYTANKLKRFQGVNIRNFHLMNVDAQHLVTLDRTLRRTTDIFVHEKTNLIVLRDTPDVIELAAHLVEQQDTTIRNHARSRATRRDRLTAVRIRRELSSLCHLLIARTGGGVTIAPFRCLNGHKIPVVLVRLLNLNLKRKVGKSQILAGLIDDRDPDSASLIPGLGSLWLLGRRFSSSKCDLRKPEIVLTITTQIVGSRRSRNARTAKFWARTKVTGRKGTLMARSFGIVWTSARPAPPGTHSAMDSVQLLAVPLTAVQETAPVLTRQGPSQAKVGEQISVFLNVQNTSAQVADPVLEIRSCGSAVLRFCGSAVLRARDTAEANFMTQSSALLPIDTNIRADDGTINLILAGAVCKVLAAEAPTQDRSIRALTIDAVGQGGAVNAAARLTLETTS